MSDVIITEINGLLEKEKLSRTRIYETLLFKGIVKPDSENLVLEIIEQGIKEGKISQSRIKRYCKKQGKLPETFNKEQLVSLFDKCENPKLALAMWLGFFCGLRIREACNLKVNDIDLVGKKVFVRNSKNTNRTKQGYGKDRVVSLPDIALSPLKMWLSIIEGGEWLLPTLTAKEKPIETKSIHEHFRALLRLCNLSEAESTTPYKAKNYGVKKEMTKSTYVYRFHTLRHSYATYLLSKGVSLEIIQRQLGHSSLDTTLVYAKLSDSNIKDQINQAFNTPVSLNKPSSVSQSNFLAVSLSPKEILQQRLAKGDIDITTYKVLLAQLE